MSLLRYEVDFSQLSSDERAFAENLLDNISYNSLIWKQNFQSAEFFVEDGTDIKSLDLPASCHIRKIL